MPLAGLTIYGCQTSRTDLSARSAAGGAPMSGRSSNGRGWESKSHLKLPRPGPDICLRPVQASSLEYHPKKASLSQAGLSHLQTKNPATGRALRQVNFGDRNEDIRTYPLRAVCPVADIANNISGKSSNQQERDGSCTRLVRAERSRDPRPPRLSPAICPSPSARLGQFLSKMAVSDPDAILFLTFMLAIGLVALAPASLGRKSRRHATRTEDHTG